MTTTVAKLSQEARAAIAGPTASASAGDQHTEWVLARARSMSAGLRLLLHEIDEIGISVRNGWITAEQAASNLAALEQVPAYVASVFYFSENKAPG
jgi:hypothetical protein